MKKIKKFLFAAVILLLVIWLASMSPRWYRTRGYDATAKQNLKNLFATSQLYFSKNPDGTIHIDDAQTYGFKPNYDVTVEITSGRRLNFAATGHHKYGSKMFSINGNGEITSGARK